MSEALERDEVISLLEKLGSEQDEDVLAAARSLHSQITESGMRWEDLLVGDEEPAQDEPAYEEPALDSDDDDDSADEEDTVDAPVFTGDVSETSKLIEKLLAREGNSDAFIEELKEYKSDLAAGEFEDSDHRYIQALYARLTK